MNTSHFVVSHVVIAFFFFQDVWNSLLDQADRELKHPPASVFLVWTCATPAHHCDVDTGL